MPSPRKTSRLEESAESEVTPLLATSQAGPTAQPNGELAPKQANGKPVNKRPDPEEPPNSESDGHLPREDHDTPLPKLQVLLLCYAAIVEPIAYFSIFPFVNQMIKEISNIEEENIGFWSGLIESLFSLTQMVLMIIYGRAADRLGRKPVLVFSLTGVAFATALFGMSKALWQMIAFRCLAGVFAGSVMYDISLA
ncbi:hypothetical protein LTR50_000700 [Elasticomyces elasticus]|nr:hypothetical protein LTR50_000700 [Elasticomyces elasticus]